jgi:myo-inositol-1(or 4)-monophosphatase
MRGADSLEAQLRIARSCAQKAGTLIQADFGKRSIIYHKGANDVQLRADLISREVIVEGIRKAFPKHVLITEEDEEVDERRTDAEFVWLIDPLDGTNNFGYGIAHCAIAITLLRRSVVVLSLVLDPLLGREFFATGDRPFRPLQPIEVPRERATVSLVTNYSAEGGRWRTRVDRILAARCKRVVSLWAPALDLALVASGALDAMVCHQGYMFDVCGPLFLVRSAGGCAIDMDGKPLGMQVRHGAALSFVAARTPKLAEEILSLLASPDADI